MKTLKDVESQLVRAGFRNKMFGRAEVLELRTILTNNEQIMQAVTGRYEGGYALLVATDQRLLLIDKKPWFLTLEDIRYDMISEVDFFARLIDSTVSISSFSKTLRFTSFKQTRLRSLTTFVQHRVMSLRQQENQWQQYYQHMTQPMSAASAPAQDPQYPLQQMSQPLQMPPAPRRSVMPQAPLLMRRRHARFYGSIATSSATTTN